MKTSFQIYIDKNVLKPIAWVLNIFVRMVGKLLRLDHSLDKDFNRIAICKFKGMGSILQATPMIHALRQKFPDSEIIFITTIGNKQIIEKITDVDNAVYINDRTVFKLVYSASVGLIYLWKKRIELYFDLEIYSDFSSVFTTMSLATNRFGFYLRSSSFRLGTYTHMMFFNPKIAIADVYMQFASLVGCDINKKKYAFFPKTGKSPFDHKYIVVNPNASDLRVERKWPMRNYISLIHKILAYSDDLYIVFIGAPSERMYNETILRSINNQRVINTAGETSIDELIHIINHAELVITNDTGPMHLTLLTDTPCISLFGPCSPEQYGMLNKRNKILYKAVYCSPCVHEFEKAPCNGDNVCMQLIHVDEVMEAFVDSVNGNQPISDPPNLDIVFQHKNATLGLVKR